MQVAGDLVHFGFMQVVDQLYIAYAVSCLAEIVQIPVLVHIPGPDHDRWAVLLSKQLRGIKRSWCTHVRPQVAICKTLALYLQRLVHYPSQEVKHLRLVVLNHLHVAEFFEQQRPVDYGFC